MKFTTITDDCLERLARGESVAECLARYPEVADQLAPVLTAAEHLRVLSQARLTEDQRLRAKAALREELDVQPTRPGRSKRGLGIVSWARPRTAPIAALVAVLIFLSVAFTAVTASQPGDFAYPVRVAVERAPVLVQSDPAARAAAELAVADRRLADLIHDQDRNEVALDALLQSDFAAAERAHSLSDPVRAGVITRVRSHAEALGSLANQAADPQIEARLRNAAAKEQALAGKLSPVVNAPDTTGTTSPVSSPKQTSTPGSETGAAPGFTAPAGSPTIPPASATPRPRPHASATPSGPGSAPTVPSPVDDTRRQPQGTPRAKPAQPVVPPRATVLHPTIVPPRATVVHPTGAQPRATVLHPTKVPPRATVVHPTSVPKDVGPSSDNVPKGVGPSSDGPRIPPGRAPESDRGNAAPNPASERRGSSPPAANKTPRP